MFHVSLLKRAIGEATAEPVLPEALLEAEAPYLPEAVLQRRTLPRDGEQISQVLIKWGGLPMEEATWMDEGDVRGQFPYFRLADKAVSGEAAVDTTWRVYKRGDRQVVDWATNAGEKEGE